MSETIREYIKKREKYDPAGMVGLKGKKTVDIDKKTPFHVLVVDDDSLIRYILLKALKKLEVTVDVAENGLLAQRKILAGNYDLVITDINMPEMNGLELLLWLKKHRPHIEGIVMTGYEISDAYCCELAEYVKDYLAKPFPMARLEEVVRESMNRIRRRDERGVEKGG